MGNEKSPTPLARPLGEMVHVLTWIYIIASPLLFMSYGEGINWGRYLLGSLLPVGLCLLFYLNYIWFIPRFYQRGQLYTFLLYNMVAILAIVGLHNGIVEWVAPHPRPRHLHTPPHWFFFLNSILMSACTIAIAVALRLSKQWAKSEAARREAELGRTAAELKNLRNQINPHFLLNTLNNIYALTAFDTEKAQQAIQELSRMLRYVLYENRDETVSLKKEAEFLKTYIELMRIRIPSRVEIKTEFDIPDDGIGQICPLLLISLVENAFKHGISPTKPSFILISLKVDASTICFTVVNSNHPVNANDKSGSGIGLKQVSQRLELAYPGRYTWEHGTDTTGNVYRSNLTIHP